jgi:hypothetical protein
MAPIRDSRTDYGTTEFVNVAISEQRDENLAPARNLRRCKSITTKAATAGAILALLTLPASLHFTSKKYIFAKVPFLKQLGLRLPASESAVLAVDVNELTIQSGSTAVVEDFESAALKHLANLHRTYARWAANHEDLVGSLTIKLRVDKSGSVVDVDPLATRLSNAIFTSIVINEIRRWTFPSGAKEPVDITIPLLFVPKGMDPGSVVQWERKTRFAARDSTPAAPLRLASLVPVAAPSRNDVAALPPAKEIQPALRKSPPVEKVQSQTIVKPIPPTLKTTQSVGLRDQPRFSGKRLFEVGAETELNLLDNNGDWLKVKVADAGSIGFIRKEFVTPIY